MSTPNTNIAKEQLRSFVDRIKKLEEEKKAISEDISNTYRSAKATGFSTKHLRRVCNALKKPLQEREQDEAIFEAYMAALGELSYAIDEAAAESHLPDFKDDAASSETGSAGEEPQELLAAE